MSEGRPGEVPPLVEELLSEVAERKRAQEALLKASSEWRSTFDATQDLILMIGEDFDIIRVNRAVTAFFNLPYGQILGRNLKAFFDEAGLPPELLPLEGVRESGLHIESEISIPERNLWLLAAADPIVDDTGSVTGLVVILRDITDIKRAEEDRKEMQSQLLQVQKMDSIGRLAGGISHDFNNMLSAIMAYSEFAYLKMPEDHPARANLEIVLSAAEKAAALTRQLLAFSRKQVLEKKVVNLGDTVENMGKMFTRIIRESITLDILTEKGNENIRADQGQIEQIIMNLAVNARDAMPDGGKLSIKTLDVAIGEPGPAPVQDMPPGRYSALSISDTGKGMSEEVRGKVFEPFFTTKAEGKGTGLGLATVYGIVKQHGGYIALDTAEGEGTTFTIYFPVTEEIAEQTLTEEQSERLGGTETILAVDSDESIRMIIGETLRSLGYTLVTAASGEEAVRIRESDSHDAALLLAEVMMPGMNGRELAEVFARRWPDTKILLMSGYTGDALDDSFFEENSARFIEKPITPRKLAAAVRGALDTPADRC